MSVNPRAVADALHASATRKVMFRLLPIMCAAYFMAYIDRTNVALAKTALQADVGISVTAFGLGAGIFFISYAFLEVPSNLIMHRVGPRRWIARIALTWGALSAAMMFVQGDLSFYLLRFLLGIAEAGLYPALMYMVTMWFSQKNRATAVGFIYLAPTIALVVGGPIGGALMELDGLGGLHGWQWMFLVEGVVTMLVGVVVFFRLPEVPADAKWLTAEEAESLSAAASAGRTDHETRIRGNVKKAFGRPFIVIVALIYLFNQITNVGIVFNIPSIVEDLDVRGSFLIGLVSGSAGIGATVGVLLVPYVHRRFRNETQLIGILAAATLTSSVAFVLVSDPVGKVVLIAVSMVFVFGTLPLFWSVAMARMSGLMAAAGLAFINTVGLIGGFIGPYAFGLVENVTGDPGSGFLVVIVSSIIGVALVPLLGRAVRNEDRATSSTPAPEASSARNH
ncbi:MFS transporter [Mycobacterium hodleri]|uniref:MFS transporter n=1 Tax=Mycolicibacterium hodleri TaxID=49897 RepID=A0A544VV21_9MYCO|nr:MFS transporter [Mycolicibacterium hodleri]TQR83824.1 MFS transporter [Mycolicibacterium hodleri]